MSPEHRAMAATFARANGPPASTSSASKSYPYPNSPSSRFSKYVREVSNTPSAYVRYMIHCRGLSTFRVIGPGPALLAGVHVQATIRAP